jgi:hypothetical protein
MSLFLQDDWRKSSTLTFNLGVRYELLWPFTEREGQMVNLDAAPDFSAVVPVMSGGTGSFTGGFPQGLVNTDANNIAPRVGEDPHGEVRADPAARQNHTPVHELEVRRQRVGPQKAADRHGPRTRVYRLRQTKRLVIRVRDPIRQRWRPTLAEDRLGQHRHSHRHEREVQRLHCDLHRPDPFSWSWNPPEWLRK